MEHEIMINAVIRNAKTGLVAALLSLALIGPAGADQFEDGKTAWQSRDYATAWKIWKPLADQGNASAENGIGILLDEGQGVKTDSAEAEKWFRRAEADGSIKATYNLGRQYEFGHGRSIDTATALRYYERAADRGYELAQFAIGMMYFNGKNGIPNDYTKAAFWLHKAADNGDPFAHYMMALLNRYGLGVPKSEVAAYAWLTMAQETSDDTTYRYASTEIANLTRYMSGARLSDVQRLAAQCRLSYFENCADQ
jgi:hypothetical protein